MKVFTCFVLLLGALIVAVCGACLVVKGAFLVNYAIGLIALGASLVFLARVLVIIVNSLLGGDD